MSSSLSLIKSEFLNRPAQGVADLFLSPFIDKKVVLELTEDDGPSLWMVNRSDVYNETLSALSEHAIEGIRNRANEKKAQRLGLQLNVLPAPPAFQIPAQTLSQDDVEEILGHPLAPFEAMLFFARDLKEDSRASAALSLTRRLLEYPPNWIGNEGLKAQLNETFFEILTQDSSAFVKSFASRIPLFTEEQIARALEQEDHFFILGRLLQNPSFKGVAHTKFLDRLFNDSKYSSSFFSNYEYEFPRSILYLDSKFNTFELSQFKLKREKELKAHNREPDLSDILLGYRLGS
jgi:hypothetical protein